MADGAMPLNSLGFAKSPRRNPRRGGDVGRRRFVGGRGRTGGAKATTSSASRCSFTTMARRWPRRGPAAPGSTSTTPAGWPRRWGFRITCWTTKSIFREAVIDEFADSYLAGATPVPCIRCNERVKFKDLMATARDLDADCMATGHYIRAPAGAAGRRTAHGRGSGARPELFPVLDHAGAARFPALSAGRAGVEGRDPGAGGEARAGGGRQARQPGHLLRAERRLCRGDREAAPRRRRSGRDRPCRRPGAGPPRRA